jgi:hypothetical protein
MCLRPTSTLLITGGDGRNELTDAGFGYTWNGRIKPSSPSATSPSRIAVRPDAGGGGGGGEGGRHRRPPRPVGTTGRRGRRRAAAPTLTP